MRAVSRLGSMRARANSRMLDGWEILEDSGWAYNPATGEDEQTFTVLFTTKARLKTAERVSGPEVGEREAALVTRELHIPWDSPATPPHAYARCTYADPTSDPTIQGVLVRLAGPTPGSQTTARRLVVEEVIS